MRVTDAERVLTVFSASEPDHAVLRYASDKDLVGRACEHLLSGGEPGTAIVIATPQHRRLITERLARAGVDGQARSDPEAPVMVVALDAGDTMARFMVQGWPDAAAFWQTLSPILKRALGRPGPIRIFGEMVALLWDDGHRAAAVDLEALWNELARQYSFSLLCAYPATEVSAEEYADELAQICASHSSPLSGRIRGA